MKFVFVAIIDFLIVGLFLYSKLNPHKGRLSGKYLNGFNFFERLFTPLMIFLRKFFKPAQVGNGLAVDMSQIILLILFLLIQKLIL
jgi:hypothetical protein